MRLRSALAVLLPIMGTLLLLSSLCAAGLIALSAAEALRSWGAYTTAIEQRQFDTATNQYVRGIYEILLERVDTNNALGASDPAGPATIASITQHRELLKRNFEAALPTIERCVQRVSQLYEQGVELLHIGAYLRRWLRWTRSGLTDLGEGLSERAMVLVVRSLVRRNSQAAAQRR